MTLGINNVYELNVDLWNKEKHSYEYIDKMLQEAKTADEIRKKLLLTIQASMTCPTTKST